MFTHMTTVFLSLYGIKEPIQDSEANHPYLQLVAELQRTQINMVKLKGILKAPSAAAIQQLTMDQSLQ